MHTGESQLYTLYWRIRAYTLMSIQSMEEFTDNIVT